MPEKSLRENIEEAFKEAGLKKNTGKGWTPIDRVIMLYRAQIRGDIDEDEEEPVLA